MGGGREGSRAGLGCWFVTRDVMARTGQGRGRAAIRWEMGDPGDAALEPCWGSLSSSPGFRGWGTLSVAPGLGGPGGHQSVACRSRSRGEGRQGGTRPALGLPAVPTSSPAGSACDSTCKESGWEVTTGHGSLTGSRCRLPQASCRPLAWGAAGFVHVHGRWGRGAQVRRGGKLLRHRACAHGARAPRCPGPAPTERR